MRIDDGSTPSCPHGTTRRSLLLGGAARAGVLIATIVGAR